MIDDPGRLRAGPPLTLGVPLRHTVPLPFGAPRSQRRSVLYTKRQFTQRTVRAFNVEAVGVFVKETKVLLFLPRWLFAYPKSGDFDTNEILRFI